LKTVESPEIRVLVELRAELGREIEELKERIRILEEYIEALDSTIGRGSFSTADVALESARRAPTPTSDEAEVDSAEPQTIVITDKAGNMELATMEIVDQTVRIVPAEHAVYDIKRGAFATFFVEKILGGFNAEDQARAENKEIPWEDAFDADIHSDDGILEEIVIRNYRTEARLNELRRALQWALEKTYSAR
jgi:hypothetical protein